MFKKEIIDCCKKLKLSQNLAEMAQIIDGESHQEYLYKLLSTELGNRECGRTATLINVAGFYSIKAFENFRFDEVTLPSDFNTRRSKDSGFC